MKNYFLFGLLAFFIYSAIENILCLFYIGKYWQYYLLSIVSWMVIFFIFCFSLLLVKFFISKILKLELKERVQKNNFLLNTIFFFVASLFSFTFIQIINTIPGKFYSISNLGISIIIIIYFLFLYYYQVLLSQQPLVLGMYQYRKHSQPALLARFSLLLLMIQFSLEIMKITMKKNCIYGTFLHKISPLM